MINNHTKSNLETEAEDLLDHLKNYVETRSEITRLTVLEKTSEGAGAAVSGLITGFLYFIFFVFISIALAYFIGEYTGHLYLGFLSVAGLYLLTAVLITMNKEKWIQQPLAEKIIQHYFKDHAEEKH